MVKGPANAHAAKLVATRGERPFASVDDVWRRAGVPAVYASGFRCFDPATLDAWPVAGRDLPKMLEAALDMPASSKPGETQDMRSTKRCADGSEGSSILNGSISRRPTRPSFRAMRAAKGSYRFRYDRS